MESNEFEELGSRIRILREKQDMTQLQLAEKLYVSRATIGHIELGNRMPSVPLLIEIAEFFDVTTDYLLELSKGRGSRDPFEKIVSPLSETEYQEVLKYIDMIKCYHNSNGKSKH
jgi:transcriptional regulator with XRE-family HTH domain